MKRKIISLMMITSVLVFSSCSKTETKTTSSSTMATTKSDVFTRGAESRMEKQKVEFENYTWDEKDQNMYKNVLNMKGYAYDSSKNVITIFLGQRNSGGYSVEVEDVYVEDGSLVIKAKEIAPKDKDNNTSNLTYPKTSVKLKTKDFYEKVKIVGLGEGMAPVLEDR